MQFETPQDMIKCVLSIKGSNFNAYYWSKFSHLLSVRTDPHPLLPPPPPPHCQPDRKKAVFFTTPLGICYL